MQILKFKKTDPKAIIPRRQTEGAAGFDLHALEAEYLHKTTTPLMVRTGISVEIPRVPLTVTAQVRMCGNSVSPVQAEALVRANFRHEAAFMGQVA